MITWLYDLQIFWLIVVVFAATYLVAGLIYFSVTRLAVGSRGQAFAAVSPGLLPPLGIVFALVVGFLLRVSGTTATELSLRSTAKQAHCAPHQRLRRELAEMVGGDRARAPRVPGDCFRALHE
jgi:uncharacterized membrane protein YedE/YeeE